MRIVFLAPAGAMHRYNGNFGKVLHYAPLTLTTLASLIPAEIDADVEIFDESSEKIPLNITADLIVITCITGTAQRCYAYSDYFRSKGLDKYDVYPPMHGIGLAEAEDPYPDENSTRLFENNMTVNTDISLFGIPELHGNRVEESLLITENGVESLTPLIRKMLQEFKYI